MSISNPGKQVDAKGRGKFSASNINSVYQGKDTNPRKEAGGYRSHGLQPLGKMPTSRRAPTPILLPSLKSQTGNNDPNVNLVPPGGAGWGNSGQNGNQESVGQRGPQVEETVAAASAASVKGGGPPSRDRLQPWGGSSGHQQPVDPMAPSYMGGKDLVSNQHHPQNHQQHPQQQNYQFQQQESVQQQQQQQQQQQRPQPQKSWRGPAGAGALKNPDLSQAPVGTPLFASGSSSGATSTATAGSARPAETRPQVVSKRQQSVLKNELDEITKDDMVATGWALAHNDELDYSAKIVFSDDDDEDRSGNSGGNASAAMRREDRRKERSERAHREPAVALSMDPGLGGQQSVSGNFPMPLPDVSQPPPPMQQQQQQSSQLQHQQTQLGHYQPGYPAHQQQRPLHPQQAATGNAPPSLLSPDLQTRSTTVAAAAALTPDDEQHMSETLEAKAHAKTQAVMRARQQRRQLASAEEFDQSTTKISQPLEPRRTGPLSQHHNQQQPLSTPTPPPSLQQLNQPSPLLQQVTQREAPPVPHVQVSQQHQSQEQQQQQAQSQAAAKHLVDLEETLKRRRQQQQHQLPGPSGSTYQQTQSTTLAEQQQQPNSSLASQAPDNEHRSQQHQNPTMQHHQAQQQQHQAQQAHQKQLQQQQKQLHQQHHSHQSQQPQHHAQQSQQEQHHTQHLPLQQHHAQHSPLQQHHAQHSPLQQHHAQQSQQQHHAQLTQQQHHAQQSQQQHHAQLTQQQYRVQQQPHQAPLQSQQQYFAQPQYPHQLPSRDRQQSITESSHEFSNVTIPNAAGTAVPGDASVLNSQQQEQSGGGSDALSIGNRSKRPRGKSTKKSSLAPSGRGATGFQRSDHFASSQPPPYYTESRQQQHQRTPSTPSSDGPQTIAPSSLSGVAKEQGVGASSAPVLSADELLSPHSDSVVTATTTSVATTASTETTSKRGPGMGAEGGIGTKVMPSGRREAGGVSSGRKTGSKSGSRSEKGDSRGEQYWGVEEQNRHQQFPSGPWTPEMYKKYYQNIEQMKIYGYCHQYYYESSENRVAHWQSRKQQQQQHGQYFQNEQYQRHGRQEPMPLMEMSLTDVIPSSRSSTTTRGRGGRGAGRSNISGGGASSASAATRGRLHHQSAVSVPKTDNGSEQDDWETASEGVASSDQAGPGSAEDQQTQPTAALSSGGGVGGQKKRGGRPAGALESRGHPHPLHHHPATIYQQASGRRRGGSGGAGPPGHVEHFHQQHQSQHNQHQQYHQKQYGRHGAYSGYPASAVHVSAPAATAPTHHKRQFENIDVSNIASVVQVDNLPEVAEQGVEDASEFVQVVSKKDKKSKRQEERRQEERRQKLELRRSRAAAAKQQQQQQQQQQQKASRATGGKGISTESTAVESSKKQPTSQQPLTADKGTASAALSTTVPPPPSAAAARKPDPIGTPASTSNNGNHHQANATQQQQQQQQPISTATTTRSGHQAANLASILSTPAPSTSTSAVKQPPEAATVSLVVSGDAGGSVPPTLGESRQISPPSAAESQSSQPKAPVTSAGDAAVQATVTTAVSIDKGMTATSQHQQQPPLQMSRHQSHQQQHQLNPPISHPFMDSAVVKPSSTAFMSSNEDVFGSLSSDMHNQQHQHDPSGTSSSVGVSSFSSNLASLWSEGGGSRHPDTDVVPSDSLSVMSSGSRHPLHQQMPSVKEDFASSHSSGLLSHSSADKAFSVPGQPNMMSFQMMTHGSLLGHGSHHQSSVHESNLYPYSPIQEYFQQHALQLPPQTQYPLPAPGTSSDSGGASGSGSGMFKSNAGAPGKMMPSQQQLSAAAQAPVGGAKSAMQQQQQQPPPQLHPSSAVAAAMHGRPPHLLPTSLLDHSSLFGPPGVLAQTQRQQYYGPVHSASGNSGPFSSFPLGFGFGGPPPPPPSQAGSASSGMSLVSSSMSIGNKHSVGSQGPIGQAQQQQTQSQQQQSQQQSAPIFGGPQQLHSQGLGAPGNYYPSAFNLFATNKPPTQQPSASAPYQLQSGMQPPGAALSTMRSVEAPSGPIGGGSNGSNAGSSDPQQQAKATSVTTTASGPTSGVGLPYTVNATRPPPPPGVSLGSVVFPSTDPSLASVGTLRGGPGSMGPMPPLTQPQQMQQTHLHHHQSFQQPQPPRTPPSAVGDMSSGGAGRPKSADPLMAEGHPQQLMQQQPQQRPRPPPLLETRPGGVGMNFSGYHSNSGAFSQRGGGTYRGSGGAGRNFSRGGSGGSGMRRDFSGSGHPQFYSGGSRSSRQNEVQHHQHHMQQQQEDP